jgi:ketosteroid isomerase-like protein
VSTNAEIVTHAFRGFSDSDMEKLTEHWSPGIVFDTVNYEGWPLPDPVARGAEEVVMAFGGFMASFRSLEIAEPDVTELDERHVLALYDETRREHGSDEPLVRPMGMVFEMEGDQMAYVWVFTDPERAKEFGREVSG